MKFKKKPIVIEAEQYVQGSDNVPEGVTIDPQGIPRIDLEGGIGSLIVLNGDFIVTGLAGERYPVRPARFWEIYEAV